MQDHINKRIPALLTIMLTEAQNSNERDLSRKETDRVKKMNGIKTHSKDSSVLALLLVFVCIACLPIEHRSLHALRNVHSKSEFFGISLNRRIF